MYIVHCINIMLFSSACRIAYPHNINISFNNFSERINSYTFIICYKTVSNEPRAMKQNVQCNGNQHV